MPHIRDLGPLEHHFWGDWTSSFGTVGTSSLLGSVYIIAWGIAQISFLGHHRTTLTTTPTAWARTSLMAKLVCSNLTSLYAWGGGASCHSITPLRCQVITRCSSLGVWKAKKIIWAFENYNSIFCCTNLSAWKTGCLAKWSWWQKIKYFPL